jgi:hypothetical protein
MNSAEGAKEPGVECKKMQVPEGGQQRPLTRNGAPIVSCFARRGDCLRGVLSRMSRIVIAIEMLSGLGIGLGLGFGMFAPFGDGLFFGGVCPQVPLHLRRGGHLGLVQGVAPPGPLGVQLSLSVACRPMISRGGLAYRCRAPWQTWLKGNGKTGNRRSARRKTTFRKTGQARSAFPPPRPRE